MTDRTDETAGKIAQPALLLLLLDVRDNVAVALVPLAKGERCVVRCGERQANVELLEDIAFGHKVALDRLEEHQPVLKYGEEIGRMREAANPGNWIHNHNMYCERGLK